MKAIIDIIALTLLVLMTYYITIYYDLKNLKKCSTLYKLRE